MHQGKFEKGLRNRPLNLGTWCEMSEEAPTNDPNESESGWQGKHVYLMATACLALGVATGYLVRGSQSPAQATPLAPTVSTAPGQTAERPTLEKMKQMADTAAAPVLEKVKSNPKDFDSLNEAGKIYRATHQFKEAASYYEQALQLQPKNAAVRTDLASCLYYSGDVEGALSQLDKALSYDPNFYGALLNIGIIRLQAKHDVDGAVQSWEKILKTNADSKVKEMVRRKIAITKQQVETSADSLPKS
jgi:cytochrome c-type biogenesis protein CcmH/NrfG